MREIRLHTARAIMRESRIETPAFEFWCPQPSLPTDGCAVPQPDTR